MEVDQKETRTGEGVRAPRDVGQAWQTVAVGRGGPWQEKALQHLCRYMWPEEEKTPPEWDNGSLSAQSGPGAQPGGCWHLGAMTHHSQVGCGQKRGGGLATNSWEMILLLPLSSSVAVPLTSFPFLSLPFSFSFISSLLGVGVEVKLRSFT